MRYVGALGWAARFALLRGETTAAYELAMCDARAGTIINITVSPHHGMPAMAHTGAARAAIEAITRELAATYGAQGVAVVA